jgi:hypothetical protein
VLVCRVASTLITPTTHSPHSHSSSKVRLDLGYSACVHTQHISSTLLLPATHSWRTHGSSKARLGHITCVYTKHISWSHHLCVYQTHLKHAPPAKVRAHTHTHRRACSFAAALLLFLLLRVGLLPAATALPPPPPSRMSAPRSAAPLRDDMPSPCMRERVYEKSARNV